MTSQPQPPLRVVSLLPSATEIIDCILSQDTTKRTAQLIGRSHECDYPLKYSSLPALTASNITATTSIEIDQQVRNQLATGNGLYSVNMELLKSLQPIDVIVTQSLCQVCSVDFCVVQKLAKDLSPQPLLVDLNPHNIEDVLEDINKVGAALGMPTAAANAIESLQQRMTIAKQAVPAYINDDDDNGNTTTTTATTTTASIPSKKRPSVAMLEWVEPIFSAGHWTPQLVHMAGGSHPLNPCLTPGGGAGKSIVVTPEQVVESDPDWVIICCCGLNMEDTKKHLPAMSEKEWFQELRAVKEGRALIIDGNYFFNRPGPRLVDSFEFLVSILQDRKDLMPEDFPVEYCKI